MLELLGNVPRNAPTPGDQTRSILRVVRMLEQQCPTPNAEVLPKLGGKSANLEGPVCARMFAW